jgi:hypothetical protein
MRALADPAGTPTVIVGLRGERAPALTALAGLVRSMSEGGREPIIAPYGTDLNLPLALAAQTCRPVLAQHGLLLAGPDGRPAVTAVDGGTGRWWQPLAERTVFSPAGPPQLARWHAPGPGLTDLGGGRYHLLDGWYLRIVPSGLVLCPGPVPECLPAPDYPGMAWVAPAADPDPDDGGGAAVEEARAAPHDPDWFDLRLAVRPATIPDSVLTALSRLADALPVPMRTRLRVPLPAEVTDGEARRVRWAVPAPQCVLAPPPPRDGLAPPPPWDGLAPPPPRSAPAFGGRPTGQLTPNRRHRRTRSAPGGPGLQTFELLDESIVPRFGDLAVKEPADDRSKEPAIVGINGERGGGESRPRSVGPIPGSPPHFPATLLAVTPQGRPLLVRARSSLF